MEWATARPQNRPLPITFKVTPRQPPGADLIPHMQGLTILVLSIALTFWSSRSWTHRFADLNVSLLCLNMHYVKQPLLALGLAIAYTVFTCIPGSWSASNLPKYSKFRQRLVIVEANDKDCMVCYDKENPLALLPCNHEFCTGCLDLMAAGYQTTCPACRTPLFNANDEIIYALTRGSVASMVTNIILLSFVGFQDYRDSDWTGVAIRFGSQCVLTPMLWFYGTLMWEHGDGWWRMIFSAAKRTPLDLKMAVFAMASGTFASWAILWSTRGYFT